MPRCVNQPNEYEVAIGFKGDDDGDEVTEGELVLIRAFLPNILKELAMQIQTDEE